MPEINLLILDFDGVLTDNKVYVFEDGREAVVCHRGDGWGIRMLQSAGIEVIILSTETNAVVSARAEKLNVACIQDCEDKASAVQSIIDARSISVGQIMYVGNDTNDIDAMKLVGHLVAPADAHPQIRAIATIVTDAFGGQGVVRELADLLLT
ncbi:MAG: HAD hydrolase family protein [Pseudomonadota bacterium]|nr:HAD hydrolase family protein [Pseudomonadota bacterium]